MLLPQELKQHEFSRSFRGYAADEVDEYIAFVISKYEALYRENDETGRKLALAVESLEELRAREAKIAALEAAIRKAAEQILSEAELKRRQILADAEEYADRIIAEADAHVASQENQFLRIQNEAAAFRDALFAAYSSHIDKLEELAAVSAEEAFTDPMPAATLAESAEEITPAAEKAPEETPSAPAEAVTVEEERQNEDVYSDEELLDQAEEAKDTAEFAEDDSDKYEILPSAEDEDVYTEEELADADLPAEEDPAAEETEAEDAAAEANLFASLFNAAESETETEPETEEIPWLDEVMEETEEIPAESTADASESEDDALLRELHEVFAREFAALKTTPESTQPADRDNDDENLNELKKRMGITEETEKPKDTEANDFSFLPEDTVEEESGKAGLFGKKK